MMKIFKKIFITLLVIIIVAILAVIAGWGYSYTLKTAKENLNFTFHPSTQVEIGDTVYAKTNIKLPLNQRPKIVTTTPANGTILVDKPNIRFKSYRWSTAIWEISVKLRTTKMGSLTGGQVDVALDKLSLTGNLPNLTVIPLKNSSATFKLAGELEEEASIISQKNRNWIYFIIGCIILLCIAIYLIISGSKHKEKVVTAWEKANKELTFLRQELRSKKITLEMAYVKLSDIVRDYISERYSLAASKQTTDEFFIELRGKSLPLPKEKRPFLQNFLQASDLIKFAKAETDETKLFDAIDNATKLVTETTPSLEQVEKTKAGDDNV